MRSIITRFILHLCAATVALLFALPAGNSLALFHLPLILKQFTILVLLSFALLPMIRRIVDTFAQRKFDVGLPVLITIYILIFSHSLSVAAIFTMLIASGDFIKDIIIWRVKTSLEKITVYLPHTGFIKRDSEVYEVDINVITVGDIVVVKPGGRAPVDGTLLSDSALLDESVITGESKPISITKGQEVPAGSINTEDYFELRATRKSTDSTLSQIKKLAENAEKQKTPLGEFINEYAKYTSLVVMVLVVIVFLITHNVDRALGLWVAMVPMIFALIGPISMSIGISTAAQSGILIKNTQSVEDLTRVRDIMFDKTGTLTVGQPKVRHIISAAHPTNSITEENHVLQLTAALEQHSEHEIGKAILDAAHVRSLLITEILDVHTVKGRGVQAESTHTRAGNLTFMQENQIAIPASLEPQIATFEQAGETPVFVAQHNALVGIIFVADELRTESKKTVALLKSWHYRLMMLTGDDPTVAQDIAAEAGIDSQNVYASLSPDDKIAFIQQDAKKNTVMMVGDGINDAPALSAATVGIAMGLRGTDLATNAAGIVLVKEDLLKIPTIIKQSKFILRIIQQDLVYSTIIHVVAGGLAAFGIITILQSAFFHEFSSLITLLNTARLFFVRD